MSVKSEIEYLLKFGFLGLLFSISLALFGLSFQKISFFSLHFFWHLTLFSPKISEKYQDPKFKYSFIRYLLSIHNYIVERDSHQNYFFTPYLARLVGPLIFTSFLLFINQNLATLFYGLLGSLVFELSSSLIEFYKQAKTSKS